MRIARTAVYLFGHDANQRPTKVGVSHNPHLRLKQLQGGHPQKLEIFALYWFEHRRPAEFVEKHALRLWKDKRMDGEWLDISPTDAFNTIGLALGKIRVQPVEAFEPLLLEATDEEVLGLVAPRNGAVATREQFERLGVPFPS